MHAFSPLLLVALLLPGAVFHNLYAQATHDANLDSVRIILGDGRSVTGMEFILSSDITFASGDASLLPAARTYLDKVVSLMEQFDSMRLIIHGHTDNIGKTTDNQSLSQRRAESVMLYLSAQGVEIARMKAVAHGESAPVASNDTPEGRARNRRVAIEVRVPPGRELTDVLVFYDKRRLGVMHVVDRAGKDYLTYQRVDNSKPDSVLRREVDSVYLADGSKYKVIWPIGGGGDPEPPCDWRCEFKKWLDAQNLPAISVTAKPQWFLGGSGSLAYGAFIRYQRSFFDLPDPEGTVSGNIRPVYGASVGIQAQVRLFSDAPLNHLYVSGGLMYVWRGVVSTSTVTIEGDGYRDETQFTEKYRLHKLAIPLLLGWDAGKWFVETGIAPELNVYSGRVHTLERSLTGENAYNSGFETQQTTRFALDSTLLARENRGSGWLIAGGRRLGTHQGAALRLGAVLSPQTLSGSDDFRSATAFLHLILPLGSLQKQD